MTARCARRSARCRLSLTNASALLWRLDTLRGGGCDIGERWRELADLWEGHADGKCLVFGDIHAAMAELRVGPAKRWSSGGSRRCARRRRATPKRPGSTAPSASRSSRASRRSTAAPTPRRSSCCCRCDYDLWQIGGSYAQRDVVNWTLTEAAVRAGQRDVALSLAHERLGHRPRSAPNRRFLRTAEGHRRLRRSRSKPPPDRCVRSGLPSPACGGGFPRPPTTAPARRRRRSTACFPGGSGARRSAAANCCRGAAIPREPGCARRDPCTARHG